MSIWAALARGRQEAREIKGYLAALSDGRPGRPMTPDSLKKRIAELGGKIAVETDPLEAFELRQAPMDAEQALADRVSAPEMWDLERDCVKSVGARV